MNDLNNEVFINLFKEAYKKCFGVALSKPLSETESKHLSNDIFSKTGLVIGAKSIKNYSFFIVNKREAKRENPSAATLDTFARYVLNAPYTDETARKEKEAHFPYWFQYRNNFVPQSNEATVSSQSEKPKHKNSKTLLLFSAVVIIAVVSSVFVITHFFAGNTTENFADDFHTVQIDSLKKNGWFLQSEDSVWWNKKNEMPAHLTLFTLRGDNWADSGNHPPVIKNLLLRKINSDCFTAEIHFDNFIPTRRWQQAGILLLEDTVFKSKSVRFSVAYNDFFGGYKKPSEIYLQAISSRGNNPDNPEEILHLPLFDILPEQGYIVSENLRKSALRIEKKNNHFRFLFGTGQTENFAFKEALNKDLDIQPKYIGIFAIQGFVNDTDYLPVHISSFRLQSVSCL